MEKQNLQLLKLKIKDQCISQSSHNSSRSTGSDNSIMSSIPSNSNKGELMRRPNMRLKQIQSASPNFTDPPSFDEDVPHLQRLHQNNDTNFQKDISNDAIIISSETKQHEQKSNFNSSIDFLTNQLIDTLNADDNMIVADKKIPTIVWTCQLCNVECIPVRRESRCLCGHRLKEHGPSSSSSSSSSSTTTSSASFQCNTRGCDCSNFFFIVAEGAWILKCRCKHKHTEHDCSKLPYLCKKCSSNSNSNYVIKSNSSKNNIGNKDKDNTKTTSNAVVSSKMSTSSSSSSSKLNGVDGCCTGFDSPWICNCGHRWSLHTQHTVMQSLYEQGAQLEDIYTDQTQYQQQQQQQHQESSLLLLVQDGNKNTNNINNKQRSFAVRQDGLS